MNTKVDFSKALSPAVMEIPQADVNALARLGLDILHEQAGNLSPAEESIMQAITVEEVEPSDPDEMSLLELYKQLSIHEDIIIIIDKVDEIRIRKGLSAIKSKETAKLKGAGVPIEHITLEFAQHPPVEGMTEGQVKLQVFLKKKSSVKVHKIILPNGDL